MAASDQAQYAIDIAAQLTGGSATLDQLDELTAVLTVGGKDAEFFAQAMGSVSKQLDVAKAASAAANAELEAGQTQYKALEDAANQAAKAAEKAALKNGGLIPVDLHTKAEQARSALDNEAKAMARLELAAKGAADEQRRLEGVSKNLGVVQRHVGKTLGDAASRTNKLRGAVGDLGGPLGGLAENVLRPVGAFRELSETFGASKAIGLSVAVGVAAVAVAITAVTVAAIAGAGAIAAWAVGLADASRTAAEADKMWARQGVNLENYSEAAKRAADATNLESASLRRLAGDLTKAGTSAADLPVALEAAAMAEKALGQEGGKKWVDGMKAAGASTDEFAKEAAQKFGGSVQRQMLGLSEQSKKFGKNVGAIFGGLKIDPLLEGLSTLVGLFDANNGSGQTLKFLFETIFQPIIDAVTDAIPLIEAFFIGMEIGALKIYIAMKPAIKALSELFGFDDETSAETFDAFAVAGEIAIYVVGALIIAFGVFALSVLPAAIAALGTLIATAAVAAAPFIAIALAIAGLGYVILTWGPQILEGVANVAKSIADGITNAIDAVLNFVGTAAQAGFDIMMGLAKGIANGVGAVVSAITGAVGGAIDAAKAMLGIKSPSKVFAEIGGYTVEGYTDSIESGTADAQAVMTEMVAPPDSPALARAASPLTSPMLQGSDLSASGGGTTDNSTSDSSVNAEGAVFNFYGVEGAEQAESRFREMLVSLMQGNLTQAGGQPA
jgi:hypothetical protein